MLPGPLCGEMSTTSKSTKSNEKKNLHLDPVPHALPFSSKFCTVVETLFGCVVSASQMASLVYYLGYVVENTIN